MFTRIATLRYLLLAVPMAAAAQQQPPDFGHNFITISDPGNVGYDRPFLKTSLIDGRGSVGYEYRIGRTEIKSSQWVPFLNAMETATGGTIFGSGIPRSWGGTRNFDTGLFEVVPGLENRPIVGINWYTAAVYCNWLHNDQGTDFSDFTSGAYDQTTFNLDNPFEDQVSRSPGAKYWIPSWDEWLKAVHYDPNKDGPGRGGWWFFPDGSDTQPVPGMPGEPGAETSAGLDLDRQDAWRIQLESYPDSTTPWGLLDASGGAGEWTETWSPIGLMSDNPLNQVRI